jgi:hypothetical protein
MSDDEVIEQLILLYTGGRMISDTKATAVRQRRKK